MYAPKELGELYQKLHDGVPRTKNGGVVGDARHVAGGGYHISRALLLDHGQKGDYSIQQARDKRGDEDAASALDWTFLDQTGDQGIRYWSGRLMTVCRAEDPRVVAVLREWFGTIDGRTVTGYSPFRKRIVTSSDKSHLFHIHHSIWRDVCEDWPKLSAFADAVLGVPAAATPGPKPALPKVSLAALVAAAKADPGRGQGGTTPGSADDVRLVEAALLRHGLLDDDYATDGAFGSSSVAAYRVWQRLCGYEGADADGIPGKTTLTKLGAYAGFSVVA
ncbi:peptidoglycan-binding protein [uncultured Friedmanniella sp.]|uniref:peptidoglycan-binding protein n=1 Tax=uncultured Friedmanniella sp. TaxID=335381 RepID=UPI0035C9BB16